MSHLYPSTKLECSTVGVVLTISSFYRQQHRLSMHSTPAGEVEPLRCDDRSDRLARTSFVAKRIRISEVIGGACAEWPRQPAARREAPKPGEAVTR